MNAMMENRSRDTIAARAAVLKDRNTMADRGNAWRSGNTIASKAAVLKNRGSEPPKAPPGNPYRQPQEQRNQPHAKDPRKANASPAGAGSSATGSAGGRREGAYPGELNLRVTPPIENRTAWMETGMQGKGNTSPVYGEYGMISQERLQEAVIWSEILGAPLSRRRKKR